MKLLRILLLLLLSWYDTDAQEEAIYYPDTIVAKVYEKPVYLWIMPVKNNNTVSLHIVVYDTILHKAAIVCNKHQIAFEFKPLGNNSSKEWTYVCRDTLCKKHVLYLYAGSKADSSMLAPDFAKDELIAVVVYAEEPGTASNNGDRWEMNIYNRMYDAYMAETERKKLMHWFKQH